MIGCAGVVMGVVLTAAPVAPPSDVVGMPVVSVKTFGARGDGKADDTNAIVRTIRASQARSLPVYFPQGHYRVTQSLTVEKQLLLGLPAGGWNADSMPMPRLLIEHTGEPAVVMKDAAGVHGLAFVYKTSRDENEKFKPTLLLSGNGLSITNTRIQYPDDAIMSDGTTNIGRTNLENVFIVQPRGTGVYIHNTLDIATIRNVEVWCNGPMQPGPAFRLGRNDELRMINCFAFKCQVGFLFEGKRTEEERTGSYGTLTDCATDACSVGYRVAGWANLNITGGDFWNHHQGIEVDDPTAELRIVNAHLQSNGAPSLMIKRAKSVIVNGCKIRRAFANPDFVSAQFGRVDMLTVTNCHFSASGPGMEIGNGVKQAVITNNIFEPSEFDRIRNKTDKEAEVRIDGNVGMKAKADR